MEAHDSRFPNLRSNVQPFGASRSPRERYGGHAGALGHTAGQPPPGAPNWRLLLNLVVTRLRLSVDENRAGLAVDIRSGTLRHQTRLCLETLTELRRLLEHDSERSIWLEHAVIEAHAAMERMQIELVGTRNGERKARHLSLHDGLTGLPNRRYFRDRLEQALLQREDGALPRLALFYLDLDGFKPINDAHGHEVGDELLKAVAGRFGRCVRAEDMASRIGGDEFACLRMGWERRSQLEDFALKLFDAIAAPMKIRELTFGISPSIGIALRDGTACTGAQLLRAADAAMYDAKREHSRFAFAGAPGQ